MTLLDQVQVGEQYCYHLLGPVLCPKCGGTEPTSIIREPRERARCTRIVGPGSHALLPLRCFYEASEETFRPQDVDESLKKQRDANLREMFA